MSSGIGKKFRAYKGRSAKVIAGADKGKTGTILNIREFNNTIQVQVQGVRLQKKHDKKEGIKTQTGYIDFSNIKVDLTKAKVTSSPKTNKKDQKTPVKANDDKS